MRVVHITPSSPEEAKNLMHNFGKFDAVLMKTIMDYVSDLNRTFHINYLSRRIGVPSRKLIYHLPHLLEAGAVEIIHWKEYPSTSKKSGERRRITYKKKFDKKDIKGLIEKMRRADNERRKTYGNYKK